MRTPRLRGRQRLTCGFTDQGHESIAHKVAAELTGWSLRGAPSVQQLAAQDDGAHYV